MNSPDWSAATFDGLPREQRRAVATLSANERFAWLNEAVALALATGALGRAFTEKQRSTDAAWTVPDRPPVAAPDADTPPRETPRAGLTRRSTAPDSRPTGM